MNFKIIILLLICIYMPVYSVSRDSINKVMIYSSSFLSRDDEQRKPEDLIKKAKNQNIYKITILNDNYLQQLKRLFQVPYDTIETLNFLPNYCLTALLFSEKCTDTVSFNFRLDFMRINKFNYKINWSLLFWLMQVLPCEHKEIIEKIKLRQDLLK